MFAVTGDLWQVFFLVWEAMAEALQESVHPTARQCRVQRSALLCSSRLKDGIPESSGRSRKSRRTKLLIPT